MIWQWFRQRAFELGCVLKFCQCSSPFHKSSMGLNYGVRTTGSNYGNYGKQRGQKLRGQVFLPESNNSYPIFVPINKTIHCYLQRGNWLEVNSLHQVINICIGRKHVSSLHRQVILNCFFPASIFNGFNKDH